MDASQPFTKEIHYYVGIAKKMFVKVALGNVKCVAISIAVYAL